MFIRHLRAVAVGILGRVLLVGYDNERGKGDHRHVQGKEGTYAFGPPEQLIEDFLADVRRVRGES